MAKNKPKRTPKTVLKLPDLEQSKSAVLNSLTSMSSQRSYDHAIREFIEWYCSEPRLAFNKTVVTRYRISLEQSHYASSTINLRLAAVRRLTHEAADSGSWSRSRSLVSEPPHSRESQGVGRESQGDRRQPGDSNKTVVTRYRISLEQSHYAFSTIQSATRGCAEARLRGCGFRAPESRSRSGYPARQRCEETWNAGRKLVDCRTGKAPARNLRPWHPTAANATTPWSPFFSDAGSVERNSRGSQLMSSSNEKITGSSLISWARAAM